MAGTLVLVDFVLDLVGTGMLLRRLELGVLLLVDGVDVGELLPPKSIRAGFGDCVGVDGCFGSLILLHRRLIFFFIGA